MSSSTSASHCRWPRYSPVLLGRCPDCPRTAPLKRLITTSDENGNAARVFVKCKSKAEPGKNLPKCRHFEWLDVYIKRIEMEGAFLGLNLGHLNLPSTVEPVGLAGLVGTVEQLGSAELGFKELKKMNN